ncbi:MAG TPA: EthD family reductase [Stellaceae bacterium]|nr:EthD family reductase [Stellaceae bacterium]
MIKVSVLYPYKEGVSFDMNYYLQSHIPMVRARLGAACKGAAVEQGLGGAAPGTHPAYIAMGHLLCDSVEAFQAAFAPHATEIMADIRNYTAIEPIIQISEVKM